MKKNIAGSLTRRESQIMEILHRLGEATAAKVQEEIPNPPGYSSVRKLLEILEGKGYVRHQQEGPRYVYSPGMRKADARRFALEQVTRTFFGGSVEEAAVALLGMSRGKITPDVLERLSKM